MRRLPREILVTADSPSTGNFRGGIYNPGAVLQADGTTLLVARNERYTERERQGGASWMGTCRPMAISLTADGHVASCVPLALDEERSRGRAEDYRLFTYASETWVSYTRVHRPGQIVQEISTVQPTHFGPAIRPVLDFTQQPVEKNWLFFEQDGDLYMLYSVHPYRLLKLVDRETFSFKTIAKLYIEDIPVWREAKIVSWSTNPVVYDSQHLLAFVHWHDRAHNYLNYGMLLDRQTFAPVALAKEPLFAGGTAAGVHPHVVYLMSVLREQDEYRMFLGEGDSHIAHTRCTQTEMANYMANATQLVCGNILNTIHGRYNYVHNGYFMREVELLANGLIYGGGLHDCTWTAISEDGVPVELQLKDAVGQLSCRMRQDSSGNWTGKWLRGQQPTAQLRRKHGL